MTMVYISTDFLQTLGNNNCHNTVYIAGPKVPVVLRDTTSAITPGMVVVPDTGTYNNGVKLYANAAALYSAMFVVDIKPLPDSSDAQVNPTTTVAEQYEEWPGLLLMPGLCFWAYVVADDDITIGTSVLSVDASNGGGVCVFAAGKGGAALWLFKPLRTWTSNTNQLQPVMCVGMAIDGEA